MPPRKIDTGHSKVSSVVITTPLVTAAAEHFMISHDGYLKLYASRYLTRQVYILQRISLD